MLRSELLEIVANGESSGIEFKRDDVRPEQLAKEIVALANLQEGRVLVGGLLHAEVMPVSGTDLDDLSRDRLSDYLVGVFRDSATPQSQEAWERRLQGMGFMVSQDGKAVCTIVGLSLFGRRPRRSLPQAGVRWMAFDGTNKDYRALDDVLLDGPLAGVPSGHATFAREPLEPGLIERLIERMTPFISSETATITPSLRRERIWHYPLEALREAVLNAFVHRDWTRVPEVEVASYSDRLEITSPGPLSNSMTIEKMLAGQRSPRNPLIVDVMRDYGYVDARGMGARRKIVPLIREASGQDARFEVTDDYVRVVLPISVPPGAHRAGGL